jgi:hypothetical protein
MLADIVAVCEGMRQRAQGPWVPKAHFTEHRDIVVGRTRVSLSFGIHVVPPAQGYRPFRAIVGIWPKGRQRFTWEKADWHPTLLRLGWYRWCQTLLRRYGYRGRWRASPWGQFGNFERTFRRASALLAELDNLERLKAEPWESPAREAASSHAPSNKALQQTRHG